LAREGGRVAIRVRDQGLGIPEDEQKQIFKKFVRGAQARTSHVRGTGIGLAIVQHIVRAHHGEIRLDSQPGKGSTFSIVLPVEGHAP
jgi:signal transduction histidine kinase